jgi:hypothetical protein
VRTQYTDPGAASYLANLHRLADALNELDCPLVTDPANAAAWVPLPPGYFTPRTLLAATVWNLATRHGQLDLTFAPSGFPGGYGELAARADQMLGRRRTQVLDASQLHGAYVAPRVLPVRRATAITLGDGNVPALSLFRHTEYGPPGSPQLLLLAEADWRPWNMVEPAGLSQPTRSSLP